MEEIKFKPDETMRICKCGCGEILEPYQKYFASVKCVHRYKVGRKLGKQKAPTTFPKWKCPECGDETQLTFSPCQNSYNKMKFEKIVSEHKCII